MLQKIRLKGLINPQLYRKRLPEYDPNVVDARGGA